MHPLLRKILDPPLFPANGASNQSQGKKASASGECFSVYALTNVWRGKTLSDCKTTFFLSYIVVLLVYRYFSYSNWLCLDHKTSTTAWYTVRIPKYENIHFRLEYRNVLITFAAETLRFQDKEYYEDKIFLVLSSAPLHQRHFSGKKRQLLSFYYGIYKSVENVEVAENSFQMLEVLSFCRQ